MEKQKNNSEQPDTPSESLVSQGGMAIAPLLNGRVKSGLIEDLGRYPNPEADELSLRELWQAVIRKKRLILLIMLMGGVISMLVAFNLKPRYEAVATIEVGKDRPTIIRTGDAIIEAGDADLKTALFILQSRPLLEQLCTELKLSQNPNFMDVAEWRSISETFKAVVGNARRLTPGQGLLQPTEHNDQPEAVTPLATETTLTIQEREQLDLIVEVLRKNLSVNQSKDSRLLTVSFSHTDPVLVAALSNTLVNLFMDSNYDFKTQKYIKTSNWLDRTTRSLKARVEQAEQEMADYTRANNIFSTDEKQTLTTEKLRRLHEQATQAETDRIIKHSLYQEVEQGRVDQLPESFSDPKMTDLRKKLGELSTENAQLLVRYGARNPRVLEVKQQLAAIQEQLDNSTKTLEKKLKADYERAARDEESIKALLAQAKSEAVQQNQAAIQFGILQQDVITSKALYNDFLQKTTQAQAQVAEQSNNIRIIEPAPIPRKPVSPKHLLIICTSLLASLVVGIGLALLLNSIDQSIKSVDDIQIYAGLPTLAVVPTMHEKSGVHLAPNQTVEGRLLASEQSLTEGEKTEPMVINAKLQNAQASRSGLEAYRILRTSIMLSTAGGPPKCLLLTSCLPGEGKSTTVLNTALSLTRLGRSVVVIDADLRRPSIHKVFNLDRTIGLSTYLSSNIKAEGIAHSVAGGRLSIIPSGPVPPNSAELLSSDQMKILLNQLATEYDHILIDSPPLTNVADAMVLSTIADGVILVVGSGKCTRDLLRHTRQELARIDATVVGAVLNNIDESEYQYGYYGYKYYGVYGSAES